MIWNKLLKSHIVQFILTVILKTVQRFIFFQTPQFDCPIDGRRQEEVGEVNGSLTIVSVDPGDWSLVTLKQVQDPRPGSMSAGRVDCPLLAANNEVVDVILREG